MKDPRIVVGRGGIIIGIICLLGILTQQQQQPNLQYTQHRQLTSEATNDDIPTFPGIAWLMTFPNSGTNFVTDLASSTTKFATGTNYGNELNTQVGRTYMFDPAYALSNSGPYRSSRNRPMPPSHSYLLTKTHCCGVCVECPPERYMRDKEEFVKQCASGARTRTEEERQKTGKAIKMVRYDPTRVSKAVHLIRNPFDNIVANFRYYYKQHTQQKDETWHHDNTPMGFRAWCHELDERYRLERERMYSEELKRASEGVPCHAVFFQYVQWHNNAVAATLTLNIPRLDLYYEDFDGRLEESARDVAEFLNLDVIGKSAAFHWNGGYGEFYSEEEFDKIVEFILYLGSEETLELLKRYLTGQSDESDFEEEKI